MGLGERLGGGAGALKRAALTIITAGRIVRRTPRVLLPPYTIG